MKHFPLQLQRGEGAEYYYKTLNSLISAQALCGYEAAKRHAKFVNKESRTVALADRTPLSSDRRLPPQFAPTPHKPQASQREFPSDGHQQYVSSSTLRWAAGL